jgi:isoamylase
MGDEVRRTQGGNNNAYCHDDATSWFDWSAVEREAGLRRFTTALISLRRRAASVIAMPDGHSLLDILADAKIAWGGVTVGAPDLDDDSHSVALTVLTASGALHLIFNAYWQPLEFALPPPGVDAGEWRRVVDTSLASPEDIATSWPETGEVTGPSYLAGPRSVVVLATRGRTEVTPRGRTS